METCHDDGIVTAGAGARNPAHSLPRGKGGYRGTAGAGPEYDLLTAPDAVQPSTKVRLA